MCWPSPSQYDIDVRHLPPRPTAASEYLCRQRNAAEPPADPRCCVVVQPAHSPRPCPHRQTPLVPHRTCPHCRITPPTSLLHVPPQASPSPLCSRHTIRHPHPRGIVATLWSHSLPCHRHTDGGAAVRGGVHLYTPGYHLAWQRLPSPPAGDVHSPHP